MKKIVIELSDETYNDVIEEHYLNVSNTNIYNAIRNGTPLQAELEEIKAEIIKGKCKYCDIDANIQKCLEEHNSICDVNDFLVILDNHISELKGENKE